MSTAVILFLVRSLLYRLEIDYILLTMAVNFLCREIHFVGTDNGVVIVAAIVLVWIFYWKDRIWANIEKAKAVQIALVGTAFTYFVSIVIARRVFSVDYLGLPSLAYPPKSQGYKFVVHPDRVQGFFEQPHPK